jgi:hypothetical protein
LKLRERVLEEGLLAGSFDRGCDAMFLRERGLTPWDWLTDETRSMIQPG